MDSKKAKRIAIIIVVLLVFVIIPFFGQYHLYLTRKHLQEQKVESTKEEEEDGSTSEQISDGKTASVRSEVSNGNGKESDASEASNRSGDSVESASKQSVASASVQAAQSDSSASNNSNTNSGTTESNASGSHVHNWIPITEVVHHDATGHYENKEVSAAYDETVYDYVEKGVRCRDCGRVFSRYEDWEAFVKEQVVAGNYSHGSYEVYYEQEPRVVHHDAVTSQVWVQDKAAYDETVTTGYKCECGARK